MQNIEIKAVYRDLERARAVVRHEGGRFVEKMQQRDVYFRVNRGRLKLRSFATGEAHLIAYFRPDSREARASDYEITPVADAPVLERMLADVLGVLVVVEKERELHRIGPVRVHLDEVAQLGTFIEFEYVLPEGGDARQARREVERLITAFGIAEEDVLAQSYSDLLRTHEK